MRARLFQLSPRSSSRGLRREDVPCTLEDQTLTLPRKKSACVTIARTLSAVKGLLSK